MDKKRRSLELALEMTPGVEQYITHGPAKVTAPAPQEKQPKSQRIDKNPVKSEISSSNRPRAKVKKSTRRPQINAQQKTLSQALVAITTRFQPATADALRRTSLERKLERQNPWSQQEIIELAVQQWLKSSGNSERKQ